MKNALAITFLILACGAGIFVKLISTPGTHTGHWFETKAYPAICSKVRSLQKLPFVNLLDWQGVNDVQPRPTLQPLEVVSPAAAGYSPEELAEIYPTH